MSQLKSLPTLNLYIEDHPLMLRHKVGVTLGKIPFSNAF